MATFRYQISNDELVLKRTKQFAEWMRFFTRVAPDPAEVVFGMPNASNRKMVHGRTIAKAAEELIRLLDSNKKFHYRYLLTYDVITAVTVTDVENAAGIQVAGQIADIHAGLARCDLVFRRQVAENQFEEVSQMDISEKTEIPTDAGPCLIRKVPVSHSAIVEVLRSIAELGRKYPEGQITYALDW